MDLRRNRAAEAAMIVALIHTVAFSLMSLTVLATTAVVVWGNLLV